MAEPEQTIVLASRFRLDALIDGRGMGDLFLGTDLVKARPVAVHILAERWTTHGPSVARFLEDVARISAIGHPALVRAIGVGRMRSGRCYRVMPWLGAGHLASVLETKGRLAPDAVAALLVPVAHALDALHAFGRVHRALTPAKIHLIPVEPWVQLGGWGLGPLIAPEGDDDGRPTGVTTGPMMLDYVAPEFDRGAASDHRVDVYSLAAIVFRAISGRAPFPDAMGLVRALVDRQTQPAPSLSAALRAPVPQRLDEVVRRGLAPDPAERYGSASAFIRDLWLTANGLDADDDTSLDEVPDDATREAVMASLPERDSHDPFERDTSEVLEALPSDRIESVAVSTIIPVAGDGETTEEVWIESAPTPREPHAPRRDPTQVGLGEELNAVIREQLERISSIPPDSR
ncbi:MAG: serine/threonine-protein kinase [Sandaracinaceae bacterium]